MSRAILSIDPEPGEPYAKTCCSKYRIVCHDDAEDTLYFETRKELESMCSNWDEDGYDGVKEFNKERRGIHTAQMKKKGRWVKAK